MCDVDINPILTPACRFVNQGWKQVPARRATTLLGVHLIRSSTRNPNLFPSRIFISEDGAHDLAMSPDMQPYLRLIKAGLQGPDTTSHLAGYSKRKRTDGSHCQRDHAEMSGGSTRAFSKLYGFVG